MSLDVLGCTRDTMGSTKGRNSSKVEQILIKTFPQFGLWAATRPHEVGIASNRESARHGEYVPEPCTHRPSSQGVGSARSSLLAADDGKFDNKD